MSHIFELLMTQAVKIEECVHNCLVQPSIAQYSLYLEYSVNSVTNKNSVNSETVLSDVQFMWQYYLHL